jgi:hypothetical protein
MSYTIKINNKAINLHDLQLKGLSGIQLKKDIEKYLDWLKQEPIMRSDSPLVKNYIGLLYTQEQLKGDLANFQKLNDVPNVEACNKKLADLDDQINDFNSTNAMELIPLIKEDNKNINQAFLLFTRAIKNLSGQDILDQDIESFEQMIELLNSINNLKNNQVQSFLTSSSM